MHTLNYNTQIIPLVCVLLIGFAALALVVGKELENVLAARRLVQLGRFLERLALHACLRGSLIELRELFECQT